MVLALIIITAILIYKRLYSIKIDDIGEYDDLASGTSLGIQSGNLSSRPLKISDGLASADLENQISLMTEKNQKIY